MPGLLRIASMPAQTRTMGHDIAVFQSRLRRIVVNKNRHETHFDEDDWLAFVVDGLGGHDKPRRSASVIVSSILKSYLSQTKFCIVKAIQLSHDDVVGYSQRQNFISCGGAAIAGVWHTTHKTILFSAGDAAVYVKRFGTQPIGKAFFKMDRNCSGKLYNCIGGSFSDGVDVRTSEVDAFESFFICTDGLWEPNQNKIEAALGTSDLTALLDNPANDDVSMLSIDFEK